VVSARKEYCPKTSRMMALLLNLFGTALVSGAISSAAKLGGPVQVSLVDGVLSCGKEERRC
jgi:hypothetical protein